MGVLAGYEVTVSGLTLPKNFYIFVNKDDLILIDHKIVITIYHCLNI